MFKDKKVIFLDVDGVLNILSNTYRSCNYDDLGNDPIERHLMRRLEFILKRVKDSVIVVSSSWRMDILKERLSEANFKYMERILGETSHKLTHRGNQIMKFIDDNDIVDYVVIEDEVIDVCGSKCNIIPSSNVIEVNMEEGLSNKNTIDTIIKLNNLSDIDGLYEFTEEVFKEHFELGFRPHVQVKDSKGKINFQSLAKQWSHIKIDTKNLIMFLYNQDSKK